MIGNMEEIADVAHCADCGQTAVRCVCPHKWKDERITAVIEQPTSRRINPAFHKGLPQKVENQKSDAQVKLDMLKTVRDMHEKDIMALMRMRSAESMQAASRLLHMGFYDAIEAMETQLKAELAEA